MPGTPLHHKPIIYGSPVLDGLFLALVVLHIVPGMIAPVSAIVAFATKKGGRRHLSFGRLFARSMWALALSGIVLDVIRLTCNVPENHTKYVGLSMPSTYPARLAFLYAAFCLLYLLRVCVPPDVFNYSRRGQTQDRSIAAALLVVGVIITALVVVRYNPWTGALWMVWSFMGIVAWVAKLRLAVTDRPSAVTLHRVGMGLLAGFSWWGALQGFGPAIGMAIKGPNLSSEPYVGNQPGPFTTFFFLFLLGWALPFAVGLVLIRRFGRRAKARIAPGI
jgi:hypothetical protein